MTSIKVFPVQNVDPHLLTRSPFNPNEVDPVNLAKLKASVEHLGFFNSVKVRELDDGTLEILGGEHRAKIAIALGMETVPCTMLGNISDKMAHEIMLADNSRYGQEDHDKMAILLDGIGDLEEVLSLLPYDESELNAYFSHDMGDLDMGELDELDEAPIDLSTALTKSTQTHKVLRFKVAVEDADRINDYLFKIQQEQGFTSSDQLTNSGDALSWVMTNLTSS